tara:strand:- start:241 stop:918 length:678 start_codon:yes stop_codon:yes gene_type:complete
MKKHIANLITLTSLCISILSIIQSCNFKFEISSYLIFTCFILDGCDGFVARRLKVASNFGKQLDSFSDMISFGVAPGILMYNFLIYEFNYIVLSHIALLIPICSALRLANYNIDKTKKITFSGLTTPVNAIFLSSIPLINIYDNHSFIQKLLINPKVITIAIVIMSILLISQLQTLNLRFDLIKNDKRKLFFIFISILIFSIFNFTGIPIIILIYIILSMLTYVY